MKLNQDCIRDTMLFLEDYLSYGNAFIVPTMNIENYSKEEVTYTIERLIEAGFLNGNVNPTLGGSAVGIVSSITFRGHEFLDTIRDNQVWSKTKSALSKLSSVSLSALSSVASQILTNMIQQQIGQ